MILHQQQNNAELQRYSIVANLPAIFAQTFFIRAESANHNIEQPMSKRLLSQRLYSILEAAVNKVLFGFTTLNITDKLLFACNSVEVIYTGFCVDQAATIISNIINKILNPVIQIYCKRGTANKFHAKFRSKS